MVLILTGLLPACHTRPRGGNPDRSATGDFTFFVISDIHIGAENLKANPPVTQARTMEMARANLEIMRSLVGKPFPVADGFAGAEPGVIAAPRGLFVLGDLTDGHKEPARQQEQWQAFDNLLPASGVACGGATVPVFAIAGNHDGDVAGPQRQGLVARNRQLNTAGQLAAISDNGVHYALNWDGVHLIALNLCPADSTDSETPFKYGQPGTGSWNDPQGALSFLRDYLIHHVGTSNEPILLFFHYGFDGFSLNDWNWWTLPQRRELYELLKDYNVAALFHGHNHHAEHYQWPDARLHQTDLNFFFNGSIPGQYRQYDVLSCSRVCWIVHIRAGQVTAAHFNGQDWTGGPVGMLVKSLTQ